MFQPKVTPSTSVFDLMKATWEAHPWGEYVFDRGFLIMEFKHVFMADFDLPPEGEEPDGVHYTVSSLEEIDEAITRVVEATGLSFRGYTTPSGGAHVFCVSKPIPVGEATALWDVMPVDQLYREFCLKRQRYACRVTPKPRREGDFVAKFWKQWGSAPADPRLLDILAIHDSWLAKYQ